MPFGPTSVSTCFIDLLNRVLRDHLGRFILVLIDDTFVCSWMKEEHETHCIVGVDKTPINEKIFEVSLLEEESEVLGLRCFRT